jgi:hypothetical protein
MRAKLQNRCCAIEDLQRKANETAHSLCIALTTALEKGACVVIAPITYLRSVGANMQLQRRSETNNSLKNAPATPKTLHFSYVIHGSPPQPLPFPEIFILSDPKIGTTK